MRRREFITLTLLGGAAATWRPLTAEAQQPDQLRRVGVLTNRVADNPEGQAAVAAFRQALQQLGWSDGRNIRIDMRWGVNDVDRDRRDAAELVALAPDVLVAPTSFTVAPLQRATRTVPIVFVGVIDPVGAGFVASLAQPGGNTTGFIAFDTGVIWDMATAGSAVREHNRRVKAHSGALAVAHDAVDQQAPDQDEDDTADRQHEERERADGAPDVRRRKIRQSARTRPAEVSR
jgi:hypothetical protein